MSSIRYFFVCTQESRFLKVGMVRASSNETCL